MAKKTTSGEFGLGEVHVTIEVVPQPGQRGGGKRFAGRWVRALVAVAALAGAVAIDALIVDSSGSGLVPGPLIVDSSGSRLLPGAGRSPEIASRRPVTVAGTGTRFGIHSHCVRQAIVSPDRTFARVDFDRATACGAAGTHVTLILRRVGGAWVAAFDATGWRCPSTALPQRVLAELRLCGER
jgi:hypothetical protein